MSSNGDLLTTHDVLVQTSQELLTRGFTTTGNYFNEVANEISALGQQRKTQAETAQALWHHLDVLGERALDGLRNVPKTVSGTQAARMYEPKSTTAAASHGTSRAALPARGNRSLMKSAA